MNIKDYILKWIIPFTKVVALEDWKIVMKTNSHDRHIICLYNKTHYQTSIQKRIKSVIFCLKFSIECDGAIKFRQLYVPRKTETYEATRFKVRAQLHQVYEETMINVDA